MQKTIAKLFLITFLLSPHGSVSAAALPEDAASTDTLPKLQVYYNEGIKPSQEFDPNIEYDDLYEYASKNKGFALFFKTPYNYVHTPNPSKLGNQKIHTIHIMRLYLPEEQTTQNCQELFSHIFDCIEQNGIGRVVFCLDKPIGGPETASATSAIVKGFEQACRSNEDKLNNVKKVVYNLSKGGANVQLFLALNKQVTGNTDTKLIAANTITKEPFETSFQEYVDGNHTLYVTFDSAQHESLGPAFARNKNLLIDNFLLQHIPATQAFLSRDRKGIFNQYVAKSNYQKIYESYNQDYCPAGWTLNFQKHPSFAQYAKKAQAYFIKNPKKDLQKLISIIEKLTMQRDPVNIAMEQSYDKDKLKQYFGYENSFYTNYYKEHHELAPNFAIYTKTPCIPYDPKTYKDPNYDPKKSMGDIHVLNVIGAAFDDTTQPDYQYFLTNYTEAKKQALIQFYKGIFDMTFACAIQNKFEKIILAGIGLGAFSLCYTGNLTHDIWLPAFQLSYNAYKEALKKAGINEISCMGGENLVFEYVDKEDFENKAYGNIPTICTQEPLKSHLAKTLYLNAWDPHSIPGNGNAGDPSLDGYWGRVLAIALLGWALSNPYLLQNILEVDPNTLTCSPISKQSVSQVNSSSHDIIHPDDDTEQKESKEDQEDTDTTVITAHVLQNSGQLTLTNHTSARPIVSTRPTFSKDYCSIDTVKNLLTDPKALQNLKKDPVYNQYAQATQLYTPFGASLYDIDLLLTYKENDAIHDQKLLVKFVQENKDPVQHLKLTDRKIYPGFAIYIKTPLWRDDTAEDSNSWEAIDLLHCFLPDVPSAQLSVQEKQSYTARYKEVCNLLWQCILEKDFDQVTLCIDTELNKQKIFANALKQAFDLYKARLLHTNKLQKLRYAGWVKNMENIEIATALEQISSTVNSTYEEIGKKPLDVDKVFDTAGLYITFGSNSEKNESIFDPLASPHNTPPIQQYLIQHTWTRLLLSPLTNPSLDAMLHPLKPSETSAAYVDEKPKEYNPLNFSRKQLCNLLVNSVYTPESRPPLWINQYYGTEAWHRDAQSVQIYANDAMNSYQFKLLGCKRLPTHTNEDQKGYNAELYETFFGITSSGHEELYQMYYDNSANAYQPHSRVMNCYFTTPYVIQNAALNQCYPSEPLLTGWLGNIHMLRVAGLDFSPNAKSEHKAFGIEDMRATYQKIHNYKKRQHHLKLDLEKLQRKAQKEQKDEEIALREAALPEEEMKSKQEELEKIKRELPKLEKEVENHYEKFSTSCLSFVEKYYTKCFHSIFTCYENNYKQFTRILLPVFGGGKFCTLYPLKKVFNNGIDLQQQIQNRFKQDIFVPAFKKAFYIHKQALQNCGLQEILINFESDAIKNSIKAAQNSSIGVTEVFLRDLDVNNRNWEEYKKCIQQGLLIVVAGNNETLAGNANNALPAYSQERIFGTTTAGVVLSWLLLNPFAKRFGIVNSFNE